MNDLIPGNSQVFSKMLNRFPANAPEYIEHAFGSKIYANNKQYIDWSASLGPVILGYGLIKPDCKYLNHPLLPLSHKIEFELAEKLVNAIPCAEMVRFFKNGSDATSSAIRLSRFVTNRNHVVCCGYHGSHDWYACTLPGTRGMGTGYNNLYTHKVDYADLEKLEAYFNKYEVACFILEPMNRTCPEKADRNYLVKVKELCSKYGVILIFDEIIMGFRHAVGGGQSFYKVTPDLATFSKAMANGFPISALVGKRELMEEVSKLQISGTFYGDLVSINAAIKTIDFIEREGVINKICNDGKDFKNRFNKIIKSTKMGKHFSLKGFGPWNSIVCTDAKIYSLFLQYVFDKGIFYNRDHFFMFAHTPEDIDKTLLVYDESLRQLCDDIKKEKVEEKLIKEVLY